MCEKCLSDTLCETEEVQLCTVHPYTSDEADPEITIIMQNADA